MKKFFTYAFLLIALSLLIAGLQYYNSTQQANGTLACNLAGKVIRIVDGDSITVVDSEKDRHKIRMAGIDAPERRQPHGKAAHQYLAKLIFKKQVCIAWYKRDKYQRLVGVVRVDGEDINLRMITAGLSWHYKQYQNEQSKSDAVQYSKAQVNAKSAAIGLWRDRNPIPPWLWRRGER